MKLFAILAVCLVCVPQIAAAGWESGNGNSCDVVCKAAGSSAVTAGNYTGRGKNPYYICRSNINKEGSRAGYNLQPNWSNTCTVGYGGKEFPAANYSCLCN
jgi:hypothetical protein